MGQPEGGTEVATSARQRTDGGGLGSHCPVEMDPENGPHEDRQTERQVVPDEGFTPPEVPGLISSGMTTQLLLLVIWPARLLCAGPEAEDLEIEC
ncbi:hypothetical protein CPLU01_04152 [Colletotrichum plurivorum]|uniref:Uncharacterized protein n=1 Tax=Colletotrichum plurivorum TaxID=2175906 RepID=A0A8H6NJ95_9PEZI|nr:hypothetical protein CPLU01_04152 [Colletotrichum plurivorum]